MGCRSAPAAVASRDPGSRKGLELVSRPVWRAVGLRLRDRHAPPPRRADLGSHLPARHTRRHGRGGHERLHPGARLPPRQAGSAGRYLHPSHRSRHPRSPRDLPRRQRHRHHRRSPGTDRQERPLPLLPEFAEQMALYSVRAGRPLRRRPRPLLALRLGRRAGAALLGHAVRPDVPHHGAHEERRRRRTPIARPICACAPKSACSPWPTASSPPTRTSAPISSGAWACRPKRSARSLPASTSSCSSPRPRAASRAEIGIAPDERVVLFVGRIDPIKGIDTLIDAAEIMLSRGIDRARADVPHRRRRSRRGRHPGRSAGASRRVDRASVASPPISASSARSRKTSCPSSTPRPTSSPCRRATSRSGWSRSRRWPAARRSSPPALAACASRSTKARPVSWSSHSRRRPWPGRWRRSWHDERAARSDVGRGPTLGRALRLATRRQPGDARLSAASPQATARSSAPAATSSR